MQLCKETVQYIRLDPSTDKILEIFSVNASWCEKTIAAATDKGIQLSQSTLVRIPVENLPGGFTPRKNDMMLRGTEDISGETASTVKHKLHAVTIKAVHDNRRTVMAPHWKLEAI